MDTEELIENFRMFDEWEDRYSYLVDLGKGLPDLPPAEKTDANKVQGCLSQVWFVQDPSADGVLRWRGDSDSTIVKGLIAVLQVVYAGRRLGELSKVDIDSVFRDIGLERHLSMNRRNGFTAMVARLRSYGT